MRDFSEFNKSYVCNCLKKYLTQEAYEHQRMEYLRRKPNNKLSPLDFFQKLKNYIRNKHKISTCNNHCEKRDCSIRYSIFYEEADKNAHNNFQGLK